MKIAVRLTNWIGDVVMNLPALDVLRANFPNAEIVAIARPWVRHVLTFRPDLVDRVIEYDDRGRYRGLGGLFRFANLLRQERFDQAFVFTYHFKGAALAFLAGIPSRIGISTWDTALFLNGRLPRRDLPKQGRHQCENYVDLLEFAGALRVEERIRPRLTVPEATREAVRERFLDGRAGPFLVVAAGAAKGTAKRWFPERFAEAAADYLDRVGGTVVLLGVASEAETNQQIAAALPADRVVNLCGASTLDESIALIAGADRFLSNDSGLMHVAASLDIPQVAVFGPTDPSSAFPYNPGAAVVHHKVPCSPCRHRHCPIDHACMSAASVDEVVQALMGRD